MNGFIVLHRKLCEWEWATIPEMVSLFVFLLLLANHKKTIWRGQTVERGQLITGLDQLNKLTGISKQTIRTCIKRLISTGEITNKSTNKFRIITISNYENYQELVKQPTSKSTGKLTSNQQATNKQLTASNNVNNVNNDNNINIEHQKNFDFNELLKDFIDMRKKIKAPITERGLNILLGKLKDHHINIAKKMLENAILNNWKSVYLLKTEEANALLPRQEVKEIEQFTPAQIEANKAKLDEIRKTILLNKTI